MDQSKACTKCKQIKSLTKFGKNSTTKSGLHFYCKSCVNAMNVNWRMQNPEKAQASKIKTRLKYADQTILYRKDYYAKNKERQAVKAKKYNSLNREKNLARERRYVENNRAKVYSKNNARRARERAAKHYLITTKELKKLYSDPCFYCGSKLNIQIDHVLPIAKGGVHGISNLVSACQKCNSSKTDKLLIEWRIYLKKVLPSD